MTKEGNVGIGYASPSYKLDVNGTGRFTNDLTCDTDIVLGTGNNQRFKLHSRQNGTGEFLNIVPDNSSGDWEWEKGITLLRDGKVGIGDSSPSYKLDVNGTLNATGAITGILGTAAQPNITSVGTLTSLIVSGNLTIGGSTTTINTSTITVDDPLIRLSDNNAANSVDTGFYGKYVSSGTKFRGLVHDVSESKWKLFETTTSNAEPTTTVNVATYGNLKLANLEATGTITGIFS